MIYTTTIYKKLVTVINVCKQPTDVLKPKLNQFFNTYKYFN